MALHQPLDLEYWLITTFSGDASIFVLISLFAITSIAAYFKMSGLTYGIFIVIFAIILLSYNFNALILLLILGLAGILFWWIRRIVE